MTGILKFMPYGAPELKAVARTYMVRATMLSSGMWTAMFFAALATSVLLVHHVQRIRSITIPYELLSSPPPLTRMEPPPEIAVAKPEAPTAGVAVPVPDSKVPEEKTIASQEELSQTPGPSIGPTGDSIKVAAPAREELPKLGEYVYTEELPEIVKDLQPRYPDLARQAQVEGTVWLRVLVGKDGRVLDVHIDQSIPMLDQAAVEAARQWVFKPAFANNQPVPVWLSRSVKFSLH